MPLTELLLDGFFTLREKKKKRQPGVGGDQVPCVRFTWCIAGTAQPAESVVGGTVSAL